LETAREFAKIGFEIVATKGTRKYLEDNGVKAKLINKIYEGRPDIVDGITNGELKLIINTPSGKRSKDDDSYIRKSAIRYKVPYITTMAAAHASAKGIAVFKENGCTESKLKSLQEYHSDIKG
jgi:carbamoyl-phosphate synthase large subunit